MNWQPWISVDLLHTYYVGGRCTDLQLVPGTGTASALRGLKAIAKTSPGSVQVALPWNGGSPLVPPPSHLTLVFWMLCSNTSFSQITQWTTPPVPGKPVAYSDVGLATPGELVAGADAATLKTLRPTDLRPPSAASGGTSWFGFVALGLSPLPAPTAGKAAYKVSYNAASQAWNYYVLDNRGGSYTLEFDPASTGLTFSPVTPPTAVPSSVTELMASAPNVRLSQLRCAAVPLRENGYPMVLKNSGQTVLSTVPNPTTPQNGQVILTTFSPPPPSPQPVPLSS